MQLSIDSKRLSHELETLASFSEVPAPAVTRIVFSPEDQKARAWLKDRFTAAGLTVREDAVGNTFARWPGSTPDLPAVGTGSHIDAIPYSGRYDGTVGVLGALEAIRALQASGFRPRRSIELLMFTSEEPTRFGIGCLGSRLLSRTLSPETAREMKDADGASLDQICARAGFPGSLMKIALPDGYYAAFVELHIEQGPLLEREHTPLGIVTAIAAPASLRLTVQGEGGHAGAVLMPDRHDALVAAAEIALAVETAAKSTGSIDTVGTVGVCDVFPGAVNSIPSRVRLTVDFRDTDVARRDAALELLQASCQVIAARRAVEIRQEVVNADAPARCSPGIVEALRQSCAEFQFTPMVSRAYHDSLFMSRITSVGMLFIPCRKGYSHRPEEYASPEDIARGTLVLARTLARLAE